MSRASQRIMSPRKKKERYLEYILYISCPVGALLLYTSTSFLG